MFAPVAAESTGGSPFEAQRIPLTFVEYFAGIGLFRMGLEAAGWQPLYANDWSAERAQMYRGFFGEDYEIEDIFAVDSRDIPQATLATCSFPCIDLSLAGKGEGINGQHSSAFWGFHDRLREQASDAPRLIVLENVNGWMYSNGGNDFYETIRSLNEIGYTCDAFVLNARSFVPQSRPRVFVIGAKDIPMPDNYLSLAYRSKRLMPPRLKDLMLQDSGIQWACFDVPEPPDYRSTGFSDDIVETLHPDDYRWWPEQKVQKHLAMMPPSHLAMVEDMAQRESESSRTFFRRRRKDGQRAEVRPDDIAGCLRTAVGGSGKQFMVIAGNGAIRMRTLTAREYARLQGVPDLFHIVAETERQSLNAFGDAVCVPVVTWLANAVLRPLTEKLSLLC